jgi:hypothetical protein
MSPPPAREWAIEQWLGMGHVTLLAGAGGTGEDGRRAGDGDRASRCGRDYLDTVLEAPARAHVGLRG